MSLCFGFGFVFGLCVCVWLDWITLPLCAVLCLYAGLGWAYRITLLVNRLGSLCLLELLLAWGVGLGV